MKQSKLLIDDEALVRPKAQARHQDDRDLSQIFRIDDDAEEQRHNAAQTSHFGRRSRVQRAGSLAATYDQRFEAVPAKSRALQDECFRIRHQVYCVENHFLDPAASVNGCETDPFDACSLHGLLRHRQTGTQIGTVRLILPSASRDLSPLPMYRACELRGTDRLMLPPVDRTAEISRFAISKQRLRHIDDTACGRADEDDELRGTDRRITPHMTLGLMGIAVRMSRERDLDYICAIMEPALIRLLARVGVRWKPVGLPIAYHGLRQPCVARIDELLAGIASQRPDLFEVVASAGLVNSSWVHSGSRSIASQLN